MPGKVIAFLRRGGVLLSRWSGVAIFSCWTLCFFALLHGTATARAATTWTVNSTGDANECAATCTLRGAMTKANNGDTIEFQIPGCKVSCLIQPASPLPVMNQGNVTIDGTTQPQTNPLGPAIEVSGNKQAGGNGFEIRSPGNMIKGLIVNKFSKGAGILVGPGPGGAGTGSELGGAAGGAAPNLITKSYIGTDSSGAQKADNQVGVRILRGADATTISENTISGNKAEGIWIEGNGHKVERNGIGVNAKKDAALGNWNGVQIDGADNKIGPENVISGNRQNGVLVNGATATKNHIFDKNLIGTDGSGTRAVPNKYGVQLFKASNDFVEEKNCISGNSNFGVYLGGWFDPVNGGSGTNGMNQIEGNSIGIACNGSAGALANGDDGVHIDAYDNNLVRNNTISMNGGNGVTVQDGDKNRLEENHIEDNKGYGIDIQRGRKGSQKNVSGPSNNIESNKEPGVHVEVDSMGNTITQNAMSKNAIRGIVLDAVGTLTAYQHGGGTNPLPVPIPGAGNNGLPAPVILGAVQAAGAKMRVIDGTSCNKCLIEIFVAAPDATGAGQGSQFIGSANATGAGVWKSGQVAAVTGQIITATATDPSGNTSEFSANFTVK